MSLNICVNLEISIVNTYAEIIDRFRLLKKCPNKQYVCLLCKQCSILRNSNKHFQQYTKTLYSINFVISRQYITLYLFIQDGILRQSLYLSTMNLRGFCSLHSSYIINY